MYHRLEKTEGMSIFYHFRDNKTVPIGVRIHPRMVYNHCEGKYEVKYVDVYGIYEDELMQPIVDLSEIREMLCLNT